MEDEKEKIDLRLVCRTCLASQTKFYKLDELITKKHKNSDENFTTNKKYVIANEAESISSNIDELNDESEVELTYWDYLYYCTRLDDVPELPIQICTQCCNELQVSYNFINNALKAHQILTTCINTSKLYQNENPRKKLQSCIEPPSSSTPRKTFRYRCKVCLEKIENKKLLKDHVKIHLDVITFKCKACSFQCKSKKNLNDHYNRVHKIKPSKGMLKAIASKPADYEQQYTEYICKNEDPYPSLNDIANDINETFSPSEILAQQQLEELEQQRLMEEQMQYNISEEQLPIIEFQDAQNSEMQYEDDSITIQATIPQHLDFQQDLQTAEFQETTTEILQQPIQLDATIITTSDGQQIATITQEQLQELQNTLAASNSASGSGGTVLVSNDLNVGNEFVVMTDGSVEQVMGNNVFFEYVNQHAGGSAEGPITLDNGLVLNNFVTLTDSNTSTGANIINMNMDNIIVDNNSSTVLKVNETHQGKVNNLVPSPQQQKRKIKCKICSSMFITQDRLKTHMLTHNEIPHFFCDQCAFYTFFKVDLTQHYRTKHKLQPTYKQLQPKNKVKTEEDTKNLYTCDLCLFETNTQTYLKRHYLYRHRIEANEVQLRPAAVSDDNVTFSNVESASATAEKPQFPSGISCKRCNKKFYYRKTFREHCKQHLIEDRKAAKLKIPNMSISKPFTLASNTNTKTLSVTASTNTLLNTMQHHQQQQHHQTSSIATSLSSTSPIIVTTSVADLLTNASVSQPSSSSALCYINSSNLSRVITTTPITASSVPGSISLSSPHQTISTSTLTISTEQASSSSGGPTLSMPSLDTLNSPISAITPSENTSTLINNNMDFDFSGDGNLFEDFEEEDQQENDEVMNLVLTSDDDFEDILNDNDDHIDVVSNSTQPFCIQCQKKFLTQYQFENHMFVHRGLAPYRCELCTNLYNTKRALIRHYKAIHKKMPTRDMIQAKGEKGESQEIPFGDLEERKTQVFMCFHCPFESTELQNIKIHLRTSHGVLDENYILQKLPYECPRCIRCFAVKARLIRHLERSHAVATIVQREHVNEMSNNSQKNLTTISSMGGGHVEVAHIAETNQTTMNANSFAAGFNNDEITIAAGVPASLLPVSATITSPLLNNSPMEAVTMPVVTLATTSANSPSSLSTSTSALTKTSGLENSSYNGGVPNMNDDGGEHICDDFDIGLGDGIEISVETTTIPTSSSSSSLSLGAMETSAASLLLPTPTEAQQMDDFNFKEEIIASEEVPNLTTSATTATFTSSSSSSMSLTSASTSDLATVTASIASINCGEGPSSSSSTTTSFTTTQPPRLSQTPLSSALTQVEPNHRLLSHVKNLCQKDQEGFLSADQQVDHQEDAVDFHYHFELKEKPIQSDRTKSQESFCIVLDPGLEDSSKVKTNEKAHLQEYELCLPKTNESNHFSAKSEEENRKAIQSILLKSDNQNLSDESQNGKCQLLIKIENQNDIVSSLNSDNTDNIIVSNLSESNEYIALPATTNKDLSASEIFDTAEVTITMSATAIGTIIPGGDELCDSINPSASSSSAALTKTSSSFKPKPVYLCNLCVYSCESVEELSAHNDKHSNQKQIISPRLAFNFECEICHCKYKSVNLLKLHMKRHIARNFRCTMCPKTYIKQNELRNHMRTHSGEKPHKCDLCPKRFSYSHHLKRHKEVFHFGKRHICPVNGCGKVFTTTDQMKLHTLNHNGNIPYKCKFCDRDFKKREHLRMHSRNAHNVNLTEAEIAEIFRSNVGYTNPHDFTIADSTGKMLRRNDVEGKHSKKAQSTTTRHAEDSSENEEECGSEEFITEEIKDITILNPF